MVLGGFALTSAYASAGHGDNALCVNLYICRQHALVVRAPPLSYQGDGNKKASVGCRAACEGLVVTWEPDCEPVAVWLSGTILATVQLLWARDDQGWLSLALSTAVRKH